MKERANQLTASKVDKTRFMAGKEKTGGRKKGTPNKSTEWIFELCQKHNFDPIETLIHIAKCDFVALGYETNTIEKFTKSGDMYLDDRITIDHRLNAANSLTGYMYPKRKAIEIKDTSGNEIKPIVLAYSEESLKKAANEEKEG